MCVCCLSLSTAKAVPSAYFFRLSWSVEVSLPTLVRSGEQGEQGSVPLVPCSWPNGCGAHEEWLKVFTSMDSISSPCKALAASAASKNSSVKENKLNRNRGSPARHCKGTSSCYLPTNPFPFLCKYRHVRMWEGNLARNSLKCSQLGEDACQRPPCFKPVFARARSSLASSY